MARFLESIYLRREIGLLVSVGWYPRNIVIFYVTNLILIGLIGGSMASVSSLIFSYIIRDYFLASSDVPAAGEIRAYLHTILNSVALGIPDYQLLFLGPLIGIAISIIAGAVFIVYFVRSPPDKILRGV